MSLGVEMAFEQTDGPIQSGRDTRSGDMQPLCGLLAGEALVDTQFEDLPLSASCDGENGEIPRQGLELAPRVDAFPEAIGCQENPVGKGCESIDDFLLWGSRLWRRKGGPFTQEG